MAVHIFLNRKKMINDGIFLIACASDDDLIQARVLNIEPFEAIWCFDKSHLNWHMLLVLFLHDLEWKMVCLGI